MTVVRDTHESHGATFTTVGGHSLPAEYGRPARSHAAVRQVVGVTEQAYGIIIVEGSDREAVLEAVLPSGPPTDEGTGTYHLHVDEDGRIIADSYVYDAGERALCFLAPGTEALMARRWRSVAGDRDVDISLATDGFGVFGVHGPKATEKVASVLTGPGAPDARHTFVRGTVGDNGVTVIRTEDLTGEEGYEFVAAAADADRVFDALINHGLNAAPFGRQTWETLTLEAGSALFEPELLGRRPAALGIGQLAGTPSTAATGRLVGLYPDTVPEAGTQVHHEDTPVGTVTRAVEAPSLERPAALAVIDIPVPEQVSLAGARFETHELPLYEGSSRSCRLPVQ